MEIGDWRGTRDLNDIYREIRELGLESNVAEVDAFGFTIVEDTLDPELCQPRSTPSEHDRLETLL